MEVTINGTSIPWKEEYKNRRSSKQLIQKVRNNLYGKLQGVSKVAVENFCEGTNGNTFCDLRLKLNTSVCGWDIEREINGTVDIGLISPVVYTAVNMSLQYEGVSRSGTEATTFEGIIKALKIVYLQYDDVVTFEIYSSRDLNGYFLVEFQTLLYPDTQLKKTDLESILDNFKRNYCFEELVNGKHCPEEGEANTSSNRSYPSATVKVMVGIGAAIICMGIIVFIARVSTLFRCCRRPSDLVN